MAIKSQGAILRVSTAEAAGDTISAITKADPGVVTATAHGITDGSIISVSGVVGMVEVNGRAFVASPVDTNTLTLKGVDTSGYTTYGSAGTAVAHTMTDIGEVVGWGGLDGQSDEIDSTHLRSTAKEYLVGLQDFGNATLELNTVNTDAGQERLRALKSSQAVGTFSIQLSDGTVMALRAYVRSFTVDNQTNGKVSSSVTLRITGEPSWFA